MTAVPAREARPRILTGDTPTGSLHLGHWVGSVKRRVSLQDSHDCYFIIANVHAYTTRLHKSAEIKRDTIEIVRDYLAMGIDPARATIFVQSEIPAIAELTFLFAMLIPFNRFPLYAVGQTADILAFRPTGVPVGEDQVPHLEMTREVARRFNQIFCNVDEHAEDHEHVALGGVFPVPHADVGEVGRLLGVDGTNKMSKSLNNAIFISDPPKEVEKKVKKIFTGRASATEPGDTKNALFQYVRTFIQDKARVAELEDKYTRGDNIGDGHIKIEVAEAINALLAPMRERRAAYEGRDDLVLEILREGTARANRTAEATLALAKERMNLISWPRSCLTVRD